MGNKSLGAWLLILGTFLSTGCGDDDDSGEDGANNEGGGACGTLCTGAGFDGGEEVDYGGGVIECTCSGSGEGIAQDDCSAYCDAFDVSPDKSYLSTEASDNDKCVCDGT